MYLRKIALLETNFYLTMWDAYFILVSVEDLNIHGNHQI
jgi:hypothetical protein